MSSEQFQAAHDSIYNTGTRLLQYLQEIRQGRLSEGDDTKSLQNVEDEINKALHALKEQKYQVAVIAAMKAGKSTFLNAVIGADILASETAACTICRTDVRHIPSGQIPRLLEYRDGQKRPLVITEGEAGEIQQKFLMRTREIREKGNPDKTIRFEIEHSIEAINDRIAKSSSTEYPKTNTQDITELLPQAEIPSNNISMGLTVPNNIPILGGLAFSFGVQRPLVEVLSKVISAPFKSHHSTQLKIADPYKIRVDTEKEAQDIGCTINEFCSPLIQSWWIDTQDQLVRNGTLIREQLVREIQADIQEISNELSKYVGESLQVKLNINPIQFPGFEFQGIDAQVKHQVEVFTRTQTETKFCSESKIEKSGSICKSDKSYTEQVPYQATIQVEDQRSFYEVDLRETTKLIKQKIDTQVSGSQEVLQRTIHKQVLDDFKNAEQQINNYIKSFQDEFDRLLKERETREAEAEQIRETLNVQKVKLNEYLNEVTAIRVSLDNWKPLQRIR
ncbi:MAG: dynamin family protein [Nostoc sp. JL34]|uniref:dynamin family protein n=1 Tax=Nostoc sp. JL34 TaxID=2815397 RepID=UPI001D5E7E4C|nr:dynamin family protein [Nostoc sp. JL34]MBN3884682.1 dynamin family protein [Nostoc sp. JL34]